MLISFTDQFHLQSWWDSCCRCFANSNAPTRSRQLLNDGSQLPWSMTIQSLILSFKFFNPPPLLPAIYYIFMSLIFFIMTIFWGPVQTNLFWKKKKFFCISGLDNSFQSGSDVEKGFHGLSGFPAVCIMVTMDVNLNLPCKPEYETKQAGTVRAG